METQFIGEEYFKYLKSNTGFSSLNEQNKESILKSIYTHLIISCLTSVLSFIKGPHPTSETQIINKSVLTNGIYTNLLLNLLYNKHISLRTIRAFMNVNAIYQTTQIGGHYERKSITPYTKWYIKKYFSKYKLKKTVEKLEKLVEKNKNAPKK